MLDLYLWNFLHYGEAIKGVLLATELVYQSQRKRPDWGFHSLLYIFEINPIETNHTPTHTHGSSTDAKKDTGIGLHGASEQHQKKALLSAHAVTLTRRVYYAVSGTPP